MSPWSFAALGSLVVAAIYMFLWPKPKGSSATQVRRPSVHLLLRWGHSSVWVLLAVFFVVRGGVAGMPVWLGYTAGGLAAILYVAFLAALAHERARG